MFDVCAKHGRLSPHGPEIFIRLSVHTGNDNALQATPASDNQTAATQEEKQNRLRFRRLAPCPAPSPEEPKKKHEKQAH
jgi:hypothetical protein